ncbi:hypothetical protein [Mesobacillus thioparans]|uniref:hypothetical protein n=1 Tax=Mesobacillus thioparans TaxID=370439 RepID=UPI0039EE8627
MNEITNRKKDINVIVKSTLDSKLTLTKLLREFIAAFIWAYSIIKLFIFDVDIYLIQNFLPNHTYFIIYKLPILLGLVALLWLFTKNKNIFFWSLYICFYPLILLFWRIPHIIFRQKNWVLAFTFINGILSFMITIKYSFISSTVYLISLIVIMTSTNKALLLFSCTAISVILILTFYNRFKVIFKKSSILGFYTLFLSRVDKSTLILEEEITKTPVELLNDRQMEKRTTNLQMLVLFNRIHLFIAKKLRLYQNSRMNFAYYVISIVGLVIFTILSFTLINLSLFKLNTTHFYYEEIPSFFIFIYYSFNNLLSTPISELKAVTPLSQSVSMVGTFSAFLILVILTSLVWSVRSQKHNDELNDVINSFEQQGKGMEQLIVDQYKIKNIEDALIELEKLKAVLIKFIYKISENIK